MQRKVVVVGDAASLMLVTPVLAVYLFVFQVANPAIQSRQACREFCWFHVVYIQD